ncbi:MAG: hypothetical protein RI907_3094 [Pseudomonadota bacterium]|jgi:phosphate transport system substrate-binding protein
MGTPVWGGQAWGAQTLIQGTGATFPSLVYARWAARFSDQHAGVSVRYSPTGSGEGIKQVQARLVQFGGTDSPLTAERLAQQKLVQIPMLVGGLVPVVNLPGLGPQALLLDGPTLAALMQGEIRLWNDPRVAALNRGLPLPALPVQRIVRADASGSTEVLTRYLAMSSSAFAQAVPVGQKPAWPGAVLSAKGSDGVVDLLRQTPGGLTVVSFDRVRQDRLAAVRLRGEGGAPVAASEQAFQQAILASDVYRKGDDLASLLARPRAEAWPITATSYVLMDAHPQDFQAAQWAMRFVYWCFMHGDDLTRGTGFAALPGRVQAKLAGRLMQVRGPAGEVPDLTLT